jgi:HD-like signal output (HDOD) protein
MEMFPDIDGIGREIQDHCAATAAICQTLVADLLPSEKSGAFLCGLMHDVGKLLLIAAGEMLYTIATEEERTTPDAMVPLERKALGYDHALLAAQLLSIWKFPEPIPSVVALHHEPALAYQDKKLGYMIAMCRIASQIERQLANRSSSTEEFVEQMVGEIDCQFAAATEEYLLGKWETLIEVRQQVLSVLGSH